MLARQNGITLISTVVILLHLACIQILFSITIEHFTATVVISLAPDLMEWSWSDIILKLFYCSKLKKTLIQYIVIKLTNYS